MSKSIFLLAFTGLFMPSLLLAQSTSRPIGTTSQPADAWVQLVLANRIQNYNANPKSEHDVYDETINSPKSVIFSKDGSKFYIHSLEGFTTSVYDSETYERLKVIEHKFGPENNKLFKNNETTVFGYSYKYERDNLNHFRGKPVESCLSHNGKYLWVTYYRRDFDKNAECPSALAIIDTENDRIVRVMPTGPLPKMIACSPDSKYIAVTHWGDNTVGIIRTDKANVMDFEYVKHFEVDQKIALDFDTEKTVDRDNNCGNCLRGTVFTPDSLYLIVGKMGGSGGLSIFRMSDLKFLGAVYGMKTNIRHLIIKNGELILSSNREGYVQKCKLDKLIRARLAQKEGPLTFRNWQTAYVGPGARTICSSKTGYYIFAAVNNACKIAVVQSNTMKVVSTIETDAYPVGMALSPDGSKLVVTAQGKSNIGGNSVIIFDVTFGEN